MLTPNQALEKLQQGNERFSSSNCCEKMGIARSQPPYELVAQTPFAIVLACSDSRVPVELVFDQGFGDIFTISGQTVSGIRIQAQTGFCLGRGIPNAEILT